MDRRRFMASGLLVTAGAVVGCVSEYTPEALKASADGSKRFYKRLEVYRQGEFVACNHSDLKAGDVFRHGNGEGNVLWVALEDAHELGFKDKDGTAIWGIHCDIVSDLGRKMGKMENTLSKLNIRDYKRPLGNHDPVSFVGTIESSLESDQDRNWIAFVRENGQIDLFMKREKNGATVGDAVQVGKKF